MHRDAPLTVTLLGSGSPTPSLARCHPAVVVSWGDRHVLVDAGDGVVAQLLRAGIPAGSIEHVAITHLHWDHVLGYPAFVWGSWIAGRLHDRGRFCRAPADGRRRVSVHVQRPVRGDLGRHGGV